MTRSLGAPASCRLLMGAHQDEPPRRPRHPRYLTTGRRPAHPSAGQRPALHLCEHSRVSRLHLAARIQRPSDLQTQVLDLAAFEDLWNERVLLTAKRARLPGAGARFDFSWFSPVILKYRKLFTEVLVASLFLQLFALVTPLFFQRA